MTVAELIVLLVELPQDAIVLDYGGDEMYHIAMGVRIDDTNSDIPRHEAEGPFVQLTSY